MNDNNWKKYNKDIKKHVEKLIDGGFYCEVIFLFSNILETELRDLFSLHQKAMQTVLSQEKISFNKINCKSLDQLTLGALIKKCGIFLNSKKIKENLENFNNLRIKVVHKLFKINFKKMETDIIKYIPKFYELTYSLLDIQISIINNLHRYQKNKIINEHLRIKYLKIKK